jgi:Flp pilus assembly protein TadG
MLRKQNSRRGNAMVEFGIASSVIFLMALGALDFGRLFRDSIAIAGAAQAGVQRGTFSHLAADDTVEINAAATAGLNDVDGASVVSEQFCDCPDNPGVAVDCRTARCTGYGLSRLYIRVRVQKDFEVFGPWPGIPQSTEIDLSNWVRSR